MQNVQFSGPAGQLEGVVSGPDQPSAAAVLCHPHPQYGGSLHDTVLGEITGALMAAGYAVLRFNFRGVGGSEGSYDGGDGEVDDFLAAVQAAPELTQVPVGLVGGYSFGAMMALAGYERSEASNLVLVAPPLRLGGQSVTPDASMLVMLGTRDDIVPVEETATHFSAANVVRIEGADHFFFGYGDDLQRAVAEFA